MSTLQEQNRKARNEEFRFAGKLLFGCLAAAGLVVLLTDDNGSDITTPPQNGPFPTTLTTKPDWNDPVLKSDTLKL